MMKYASVVLLLKDMKLLFTSFLAGARLPRLGFNETGQHSLSEKTSMFPLMMSCFLNVN